jgi:hypothetical protein
MSDEDVFEMISFIVRCGKKASMYELCEQLEADAEIVRPAVIRLRIAKRVEPSGKGWQPVGCKAQSELPGQPLPHA